MKYYLLAIIVALPSIVLAQSEEVYTFNRSIPFLDGLMTTANLADALFNIAIVIAAILVVVRLVWAGSKYMLSGLVTSKESAKEEIRNALIGLLIILGSVTILQTINPQLLNLNALGELDPVELKSPAEVDGEIGGAYVDGDFTIGDKKWWTEMRDFCQRDASRDELCISRIVAALGDKCDNSGGILHRNEDDWFSGSSWTCKAK